MILEGIFIDSIPDGWDYVPIGSVCDFAGGTQPPKSTFEHRPLDGYVRLLQIRDFETDDYAVYIPRKNRLRLVNESDVSIARYGASVGRILTGKSGAINVAIMTTFPVEARVSKAFLYYLLQHEDFQRYVRGLGGRAAQAGFNKGEIGRFKFPLPPLNEQRQIALVLSAVQRAIERQDRLIALTAELKTALMHKLFTEGTRGEPLKQTEIGPVPESWFESRLGTIAHFSSGGTPSREVSEYWVRGTIPWVKTTEIDYCTITATEERITPAGLNNSSAKILPAGTLLMAMYGQGITRGRVAILGIDAATNQACAAITPHSENEISTGFLYYFLEFHYENLRQRGHGANQMNLSMTLLKQFPVYYPTRDKQHTLVQSLRALDAKVNIHERHRTALAALFRTLLHQLMTAQIRVHDLDLSALDEPVIKAAGAT